MANGDENPGAPAREPAHQFSRRHKFSDWPNGDVPPVAAGVYAIWEGDLLIYCGMSGRGIEGASSKQKYGLIEVLQSFTTYRLAEWGDLLADAIGVVGGYALNALISIFTLQKQATDS
jgi:hypothetical protein